MLFHTFKDTNIFASNPNRINLSKLEKSVGHKGANKPLDVLVVQRLLNFCKTNYTGKQAIVVDGLYGSKTCEQIKFFQRDVLKFQNPDGLIQPDKTTHKRLLLNADTNAILRETSSAALFQKSHIDISRFASLYNQQFPSELNLAALKKLIDRIFSDAEVTDIRWIAYMLATVKRECGLKMSPVREIGRGRGKDYDRVIKVVSPST